MAQFLEFIGNHWILSTLWIITVGAIIAYHQRGASNTSVGPQQAVMMINRQDAVVVDVRDKKEFESGHIVDAINIPFGKLKQRLKELNKHKGKPLIVVCKLGQQSGEAARTLKEDGHEEVFRMSGGITEWKTQSLPLVKK